MSSVGGTLVISSSVVCGPALLFKTVMARSSANCKEFLATARHELQEADWHIISLKDEISSWEIKWRDAHKEVSDSETEITKLENTKIFREGDVDREAKARLDRHQATLPFEVSV